MVKRVLLQQSNRLVGAIKRRQWKLVVVLSRGENWWTGVLCFALYFLSLYEPGCFVALFGTVPISLSATSPFKQDSYVCTTKTTREQHKSQSLTSMIHFRLPL